MAVGAGVVILLALTAVVVPSEDGWLAVVLVLGTEEEEEGSAD